MLEQLIYYMKTHRRWFLAPIILTILLLTLLVTFSHLIPIVSPFIYTMF